jgi:hypothetical protein
MDHLRRVALLILIWIPFIKANTIGLIACNSDKAYPGYTLFAPTLAKTAYLIGTDGRQVHEWNLNYVPGLAVHLMPGGNLLATGLIGTPYFHAGGKGGMIQEFDWNGQMTWEFRYSDASHCQHHDIERLPDGNMLLIAWEYKSKSEAMQSGRNPLLLKDEALWPDHLIEVNRNGSIVWEWHLWDHLIQDFSIFRNNYGEVFRHPELVDINYTSGEGAKDWTHINSVDYNPGLDQILLSVHEFNEIWIIEHSENSEIASGHTGGRYGHGGDLLYRWGNPLAYRAGDEEDQKLFQQHDACWIGEGLNGESHILVFNNGWLRRPVEYASVDEIVPPVQEDGTYARDPGKAYGPDEWVWRYAANPPESFKSNYISGAQRLPNGNTLVCVGATGTFLEITPEKNSVWEYINPVTDRGILEQGDILSLRGGRSANPVFRCERFSAADPELKGQILIPGDYIEHYATSDVQASIRYPGDPGMLSVYPNPFNPETTVRYALYRSQKITLTVCDIRGHQVRLLADDIREEGYHWAVFDGSSLSNGVYLCMLRAADWCVQQKILLLK